MTKYLTNLEKIGPHYIKQKNFLVLSCFSLYTRILAAKQKGLARPVILNKNLAIN